MNDTPSIPLSPETPGFVADLQSLLNRYSLENGSDTPDFILSRFLLDCLAAWNRAICRRGCWHGRDTEQVKEPQSAEKKESEYYVPEKKCYQEPEEDSYKLDTITVYEFVVDGKTFQCDDLRQALRFSSEARILRVPRKEFLARPTCDEVILGI